MDESTVEKSDAAAVAELSRFNKIDWLSCLAAFTVALVVYICTLAPSVTLEYSGSLATAADHLGVANPPGYPVWVLIAWFFQLVFGFVTYHGHPNPAWAIGLMSAFFSAATAGLVALLISRCARGVRVGTKQNWSVLWVPVRRSFTSW